MLVAFIETRSHRPQVIQPIGDAMNRAEFSVTSQADGLYADLVTDDDSRGLVLFHDPILPNGYLGKPLRRNGSMPTPTANTQVGENP